MKGEILFDEPARALYSTDASIFQVKPVGVIVPENEEDVQALVRYAAENQVALIARGAGTGVAGEALGSGIIVDLSKHFRGILEVGTDTVRVQPGVVYRDLNVRLAAVGRRFAPDPASGHVCTIGGMLANNASGAHALRFGYTRDHVHSLRAVLDSGDALAVGQEPVQPASEPHNGHLHDIVVALAYLLEENAELIRSHQPRTPYNRCGYLLHDIYCGKCVDLSRLLVGSEGTLALFTEATLRTVPLPGGRALVLLGFPSLDTALQAVLQTLPTAPSACELIDRRLLSLARGNDALRVAALVPAALEAVLLVEYEAETPSAARAAAEDLAERLTRHTKLALHVIPAYEAEEIDRLWSLREMALPSLYGLKGGPQPVPFAEDVGVPVKRSGSICIASRTFCKNWKPPAPFSCMRAPGRCTCARFSTCNGRRMCPVCWPSPRRCIRWPWISGAPSAPSTARAWPARPGSPGNTVRSTPSFASSRRSSIPRAFSIRARSWIRNRAWQPGPCGHTQPRIRRPPPGNCAGTRAKYARRAPIAMAAVIVASRFRGNACAPFFTPAMRRPALPGPRRTCYVICSSPRQTRTRSPPPRSARLPICASTARCAPWNVRPMSIFPS